MKRILSLLLVFSLIFALCACGSRQADDVVANNGTTSQTEEFKKPQTYASVLLVTINPQFKLYLDANGGVLAVEPVNDDAKSVADKVNIKSAKIDVVMESIVSAAKDGGFVEKTATVKLDVLEIKDESFNAQKTLSEATVAVDNGFNKINVEVEVTVEVSADKNESSSTQTNSSEMSSTQIGVTNDKVETEPEHKHKYSDPTCTEPAKCACGDIKGKATGIHRYVNGKCVYCYEEDPSSRVTDIKDKKGVWKAQYVVNGTLYDVELTLTGELGVSLGIGDPFSNLPEDFQEDIRQMGGSSYVKLDGKEYYIGRGDGDGLAKVSGASDVVIITDLEGAKLDLTRVDENTLEVKGQSQAFSVLGEIPRRTKFVFVKE